MYVMMLLQVNEEIIYCSGKCGWKTYLTLLRKKKARSLTKQNTKVNSRGERKNYETNSP